MPEGTIDSYDPEEKKGYITPEEGEGSVLFELEAVRDSHTGEEPAAGEVVTYNVDRSGDVPRATSVHRMGPRGYG